MESSKDLENKDSIKQWDKTHTVYRNHSAEHIFVLAAWIQAGRLAPTVHQPHPKETIMRYPIVWLLALVLTGCSEDILQAIPDFDPESENTPDEVYGGELIDTIVGCVAKNVLSKAVTKVLEDSVGEVPVDDDEGDKEGGEEKKNEDGGDEK